MYECKRSLVTKLTYSESDCKTFLVQHRETQQGIATPLSDLPFRTVPPNKQYTVAWYTTAHVLNE